MMSDSRPEDRKNSGDNVFRGIPVAGDEATLFLQFLDAHDLAANSRRAFAQDMRKFGQWFTTANREPLAMKRVTVRDITDFREHLRREQGQAVATVNRAIVTVRKFFGWLADQGHVTANPAKPVKELKRQALAPKGLGASVKWWWSSSQGQLIPKRMPNSVEILSTKSSDCGCSQGTPVHAGAFQADADKLFHRGFDHSGSDLPVLGAKRRVIRVIEPRLDVIDQRVQSLSGLALA